MTSGILFVTGTDTGVGKTVVAAGLVRGMRRQGRRVAGLKPLCSGGRADAEALRDAMGGGLPLDVVNPWHFPAAVAPALAARRRGQTVSRQAVVQHVRRTARTFEVTVVEGAGGLLSPLGQGFDSRDLIRALRAAPIVVTPNRLGALNQGLLVLEALPRGLRPAARLVLVTPAEGSPVARSNVAWLRERLGADRVISLPWWGEPLSAAVHSAPLRRLARACLDG